LIVHRLGTARHPVWSGDGAAAVGGRWNAIGTAVIYAASSLSLAMLETLAQRRVLNRTLHIAATIPEDMRIESVLADPPRGWSEAHSAAAIAFGTEWARQRRSAILLVPSALVPQEANVLINPAHPDAARIIVGPEVPLVWDRRLFGLPEPR
jgi:RES domain-containing protein